MGSVIYALLKGDVIGAIRVRPKLIIRAYNTKGGQDTREIQVHPNAFADSTQFTYKEYEFSE